MAGKEKKKETPLEKRQRQMAKVKAFYEEHKLAKWNEDEKHELSRLLGKSFRSPKKAAKDAFEEAFETLGGVNGLVEFAESSSANRGEFYKLFGRMLPTKQDVDVRAQRADDGRNLDRLTEFLEQREHAALPAGDVEGAEGPGGERGVPPQPAETGG